MKKFLLLVFSIILLFGCTNTKVNDQQKKVYDGFKDSLINNGDLVSANIPFRYSLKVEETNEGYLYTVIIDKPLVAMNNIQMMVMNPIDLDSDYYVPTVGIFSETDVHMLPNQSNEKTGYLTELKLQGLSKEKDFKLNIIVSWKDDNQLSKYQVFFTFDVLNGELIK